MSGTTPESRPHPAARESVQVEIGWGLLAAACFGASDFAAGMASRRYAAGPVTVITQAFAVATVIVAILIVPGGPPTVAVIAWGAAGGVGNGLGTLALYKGLAGTAMSIAASCSALTSAIVPALTGLALGAKIDVVTAMGLIIALPAIGLVSWLPRSGQADRPARAHWAGVGYGLAGGLGFAVLFIAINQAGTGSGAWPLLPSAVIATAVAAPFARTAVAWPPRRHMVILLSCLAGVFGGGGMLAFLIATSDGTLTIVAVLTGMYPAVTIVAARALLAERWTAQQVAGLLTAAAAIILISIG